MTVQHAIQTYHDLLTASVAAESQGELEAQQQRPGVFFGDRTFVFHSDSIYGCLTRPSTAALLNVTAGGDSTAPTFLITKR